METSEELHEIINMLCILTQNGDTKGFIDNYHRQSPIRQQHETVYQQLFNVYKLDVEELEFKYIYTDDTFAYARSKQLSKRISGPDFNNNVSDQLYVFKKQDCQWKIWTTTQLSLEFVN